MAVAVQTDMAVPPVYKFGTEEQKQRYLVPAIKGEKIFCLGITEPDAGSDVQNIQTTATKVDGGWVINGRKIFITNGRRAHAMTLVAKTDRGAGHHGISLFIVDTDTPGYEVARTLDKVGMRSSDTGEITFTDMFVPDDALLGKEGEGFYNISWELQGERLIGAAGTIAGAKRMFEAGARVRERTEDVRQADRQAPGDPSRARRHGDRDRGRAATRLHGRVEGEQGRVPGARDLDGEAPHRRGRVEGRRQGAADLRRATATRWSSRSSAAGATRA